MKTSESATIAALRNRTPSGCLVVAPIVAVVVVPLMLLVLALPAYLLFCMVASVHALLAAW